MKSTTEILVFIVDDDKMFLETIKHSISYSFKNVKIKTFSTGEDCLQCLYEDRPNIIFLDYLLNGDYPDAMNGIKVLDKIKKEFPEMVVIMMSGQDSLDVAVKTMKYGAFDYAVKNDKVLMCLHNIFKNILYTFKLKNEMRDFKLKTSIAIVIIIASVLIIYLQLFTYTFSN